MKHRVIILIFLILVLCFYKSYGQTVTDINGNLYNTVVIGNQEWLKENLKTTLRSGFLLTKKHFI